jgi:hypothetical protein
MVLPRQRRCSSDRSISLSEDRPEDLTEEVDYRGSLQRYAQLRYGSENSRRVVLVVDELDAGEFQLFVDADRDRRITSGEMVVGQGRARTFGTGQEASLEAVGQPRFVLNTDHGSELHRGATISVKPRVYTQDGLLINLSCRGRQIGSFDRERSHNQCHIKLTSPSGETLSSAQSGFS